MVVITRNLIDNNELDKQNLERVYIEMVCKDTAEVRMVKEIILRTFVYIGLGKKTVMEIDANGISYLKKHI